MQPVREGGWPSAAGGVCGDGEAGEETGGGDRGDPVYRWRPADRVDQGDGGGDDHNQDEVKTVNGTGQAGWPAEKDGEPRQPDDQHQAARADDATPSGRR